MKNFKGITRQVYVLGMVSLFTDFASEMLYPITPLFLTAVLGSSMTIVGLIEGVAEITAGFLKGYFGALSDKLGKRSIFIVVGYGLSGAVKSIPGLIASVPSIVTARIIDRIGKGMRTAPRDALLAAEAKGNSGAVFGFHRSMDTIGAIAGPLTALALLYFIPNQYQTIYLLALIPSAFALVFTLMVKEKPSEKKAPQKKLYSQFWKTAPSEYKKLLFVITTFSLINSSDVFLILKSKDISGSDTVSILGYVFYNFIYAAASYPIGLVSDKVGKKKMFSIGLFLFAIVYFGFALSSSSHLIWLLFTLYGIYAASTEGVSKAWVSDLISSEYRGTAIGLLTMLSSFAVMLGSFLTGILWDKFGSQIPFLLSGFVSLVIAFYLMLRK